MTGSNDDRIAAFDERFAKAQATEVVDLPWGFALLNSDFPTSHMHNRVVVNALASSTEILATTNEVLGAAGIGHRFVSIKHDDVGREVGADFAAAGYDRDTTTTMIYGGGLPDPPANQVRAVPFRELRPAVMRDWRLDLPKATEDVIAQLADRMTLYSNGAEVTFLAVHEGEEIAARVDLYVDPSDRVAQIESLVTHPDYRGRGHAKSLVLDALRRSHEAQSDVCFLIADLHDWPRDWYGRLGFVETSLSHDFTKSASGSRLD